MFSILIIFLLLKDALFIWNKGEKQHFHTRPPNTFYLLYKENFFKKKASPTAVVSDLLPPLVVLI